MSNVPLEPLFKELDNFIQSNDFDNAVGICDKILGNDPNDEDATTCKIIALIQLSKFDEALKFLDSTPLKSNYGFERAYSLYRLKKHKECLQILKDIPEPKTKKVLELEAQLHYRLEDWPECIKSYERLLTEFQVNSPELKTNLLSAYVAGGKLTQEAQKFLTSNKSTIDESYEFCYNAACLLLESGDFNTATKYLSMAESACRKYMKEEGASEQEIVDEISIIKTQLAYVYQLKGDTEKSLELYNEVLKSKPSDETITAVASNNVVVIKRDHDLFDSFKKLKQATSQTLEQKLTPLQKKVIGFNRCLVLLHMNKGDQCRELVKLLQEQFPESEHLTMILASLLFKEKKPQKAEEILKQFSSQHPDSSLRIQLSLAQMQLANGNVAETINMLKSIASIQLMPGLIAALVTLYEQTHKYDEAIEAFDQYIASLETQMKNNNTMDQDRYIQALKENACFKLKHRRYKQAAATFEKIVKLKPNDLEAMPGLVIATAQFDPKTAERYEGRLPGLVSDRVVDAEALENENLEARITKFHSKQEAPDTTEKQVKKKTEKKKKKKKKKLPKDLTKPIDPERWIPLKERSYFRKKGKKKAMEKQSQGAVEKTAEGKKEAILTQTAKKEAPSQEAQPVKPPSALKKKKKGKKH